MGVCVDGSKRKYQQQQQQIAIAVSTEHFQMLIKRKRNVNLMTIIKLALVSKHFTYQHIQLTNFTVHIRNVKVKCHNYRRVKCSL